MICHAHTAQCQDRSDWQLLSQHLQQVGARAAAHAAAFGGQQLADVAGRLHDLGKYTAAFQRRLSGDLARVDHATWGARIARQRYPGLGTLLAYAIAGHHAGLANGRLEGNEKNRPTLSQRLSEQYRESSLPPLLAQWQQEIALPEQIAWPAGFQLRPPRQAFQLCLLTRMIFSCLVDADYLDTDAFYRAIEGRPARSPTAPPTLAALRQRLDRHLATLPSEGGINPLRGQILQHVRAQAALPPGLFSLTVPTGGGKTLASLAFALDHAIAHGLRRVIYVAPFTSIIEQNAQVLRQAFGDLGEDAVLEHHSALHDDPRISRQSIDKRRLAMENWDAPVVVTTAVQFFESLFADRPARCRKLHNIAASVVILDEAQTLPVHLLQPCVALLDELALNYRTSLMLCTATQPALAREQGFKNGLDKLRELAPEPARLYQQLRRVGRHLGRLDDDALCAQLRQREQVLCIVNNRRHARALYQRIAELDGAFHLSTLMHARHRSQTLATIRQRLDSGQPCRLISTSLIEAGVDVDFPTVLRAEAGLESIAQAAGRCNREGRRPQAASEVLVFDPGSADADAPEELQPFAAAFRAIERRHHDDLLAPAALAAYFQELYFVLGERKLDQPGLLDRLQGAEIDSLPLESLARKFRLIETVMRPLIVPFDPVDGSDIPEVRQALAQLADAPAAARALQAYLVQVPQQAYEALLHAHAIAPVAQERYGDQFMLLLNPRLYDARLGLHWDEPQFLKADLLVW
jgi:CRISPR-associated endonuclease/helicase Cas3